MNHFELRGMLRRHAAGVAVVTTVGSDGTPVGMTVNSFTSVSFDPPLVSFCVGNGASARPAIERAERFAVTVLGAGQADLAGRFATSGIDRFAGTGWSPGDDGLPSFPGGLTRLSCAVVARHPVGDHILVLGRVEQAERGPDEHPLVHHAGQLYAVRQPDLAA